METQTPYATAPRGLIAFSGTHSTGKTTAVLHLADELMRAYPATSVGIIHETARCCPYPVVGRRTSCPLAVSQRWIFAAQIRAELDALARYDLVVCDRTICDCIAYTLTGGLDALARAMLSMAAEHVGIYRKIYIMLADPTRPAQDDGFRNLDERFRLQVQDHLVAVYHRLGIVPETWRGTSWAQQAGAPGVQASAFYEWLDAKLIEASEP
jgi:thymidylate kinase